MERVDITIYGATGFTGHLIAIYLMGKQKDGKESSFTLALAARNLSKLRSKFPSVNETLVSFVEASNDDEQSLHSMCRTTKILVNCVGPFDLYGRAVVKACVEQGCHYTDITGEPKFFREMVQEFHEEAKRKNLKIVPACGYDCIPADMGTLFLLQQLPSQDDFWKNTNVEPKVSVEGCIKAYIPGGPSGGSYITLINSLSSMFQRKSTTKSEKQPTSSPQSKRKRSLSGRPFFSKELKMWIVPFPTADPHIVARSSILNQYFKKGSVPFEYGNYLQLRAFWMVLVYYLFALVFIILCQFSLGRKLLHYIGKQSGEGPTQEQMAASTFSFDLIGRATSSKGKHTIFVSVSGKDLRYGDTAKMCGETVLCMLYDFVLYKPDKAQQSPSPTSLVKGEEQYGVLTTAAALGYPLIHRLNKAGIKFEMKRITFSKHETSQEATGMEKIEHELSKYVYLG